MYFENGVISVVLCKEYTLYCFIKANGEMRYTYETINSSDPIALRHLEDLETQLEMESVALFESL